MKNTFSQILLQKLFMSDAQPRSNQFQFQKKSGFLRHKKMLRFQLQFPLVQQ